MLVKRRLQFVIGLVLGAAAVVCAGQAKPAANNERQAALALEQQGKIAEAEAVWRTLSKANPSNPEPYAHLGLLEARQQHYKEAVPLYRKALELGPPLPGLRLNLGLALFRAEDLKGAIQEFEPLLRSNPGNQQLAALLAEDRISTAGAGVGVFLLKDENGATLHAGDKCWLTAAAPQEFGKNKSDVTWKFAVVMKPFATIVGGN